MHTLIIILIWLTILPIGNAFKGVSCRIAVQVSNALTIFSPDKTRLETIIEGLVLGVQWSEVGDALYYIELDARDMMKPSTTLWQFTDTEQTALLTVDGIIIAVSLDASRVAVLNNKVLSIRHTKNDDLPTIDFELPEPFSIPLVSWSPNGGVIAVTLMQLGFGAVEATVDKLLLIDVMTGDILQEYETGTTNSGQAKWSFDGRAIAWEGKVAIGNIEAGSANINNDETRLFILDIETSRVTDLGPVISLVGWTRDDLVLYQTEQGLFETLPQQVNTPAMIANFSNSFVAGISLSEDETHVAFWRNRNAADDPLQLTYGNEFVVRDISSGDEIVVPANGSNMTPAWSPACDHLG